MWRANVSQPLQLPPVMGHRGAASLAPENTLAGLAAAAQAGCHWVELDVMLARDGVPVLHHDPTLKRTAGITRKVSALSAARLADIDVGRSFDATYAGEKVPDLATALERLQALGLRPNLEMKPTRGREAALAEAVGAALDAIWPATGPRPMVSSFSRLALAAARDRAPAYPRGLIVLRPPRQWARILGELDCVSLHVSRRHLTLARAEALANSPYALAVYTVNEPDEARLFRRWGAQCIITDTPQHLDDSPL